MSTMVNRLKLSRKIIKRFVNIDSDDEECGVGSDVEIIEDNSLNKPENSLQETKTSPNEVTNDNKFINYKVFVRNCGQTEHRFVDLNGNNPFVVNDSLDQLMACNDLSEMSAALNKVSNPPKKCPKRRQKRESDSKVTKTEDEFQSTSTDDFDAKINELEAEGIRHLKNAKKAMTFKCLVCDVKVRGFPMASDHCQSDSHLKKKFGDHLKGMDALFTIDSESIGDSQIAIARRRELKKIKSEDKERYLRHGIRLKNGFGAQAYICSKCDLTFDSLTEVENHSKITENLDSEPNGGKHSILSPNRVDQKLHSEGIKSTDFSQFYCVFCNIYFECKRLAVSHISDTRHKKQKRGENLNEIDSNFTVMSDKIDDLEVAFARKTALKTISMKTKIEWTDNGIRLEDGVGENAFKCMKCELPIGGAHQIEEHLKSLLHTM